MTPLLADAQSAILVSIYKPLVMVVVFAFWARLVARIDKDLQEYFLPRTAWNAAQMGAGMLALLLWLVIPWFWVGIWVALAVLAGGVAGYVAWRNPKVPAEAHWGLTMAMLRQKRDQAAFTRSQQQATIHLMKKDGQKIPVPPPRDAAAPAYQALTAALEFALPRKAERIDLAVAGTQQVALAVSIDGVKYPQTAPDGRTAVTLIDYLKQHAGLDVAERRKKQVGELRVDAGGAGKHALGVTTVGSTRELALTLFVDPGQRMVLKLDKMGLLEGQLAALRPVLAAQKGTVLVAAPRHQGLTTTLYSLLQQHDPYTLSIMTLEEEINYEIEGVSHNVLDPGESDSRAGQKVAAILRQDPQVMMVSRVTDAQSARVIAQSSAECRVYAGLHQENTFGALSAWAKAVGDPALAAANLRAIVAQRLVRRLCPTCRVPFTPDPTVLKRLNLPPDKVGKLYKQSGQVMVKNKPETCPNCLGIAYQGRVGVFEVMVLDDPARKMVAEGQTDPLRLYLRKQKMLWLQEAALTKAVEGVTSISEITRALAKAE